MTARAAQYANSEMDTQQITSNNSHENQNRTWVRPSVRSLFHLPHFCFLRRLFFSIHLNFEQLEQSIARVQCVCVAMASRKSKGRSRGGAAGSKKWVDFAFFALFCDVLQIISHKILHDLYKYDI